MFEIGIGRVVSWIMMKMHKLQELPRRTKCYKAQQNPLNFIQILIIATLHPARRR
jgi:hypothetical protein